MTEFFSLSMITSIAFQTLRLATPYIYTATGETITQKSGVLNLGVEGIMLMGAFISFSITYHTRNPWLGLGGAAVAGILMGLLMAVIVVTFQGSQPITGIGINMFSLGLTSLWFVRTILLGTVIPGIPTIKIPLLGDVPILGEIFFNHNPMVYGAYLLVPITHWFLTRTTLGLNIRAIGENPSAADSLGVNVAKTRYLSVSLGGMLAGIGGASLSIGILNLFQENVTAGIGLISVGLVVFGGWSPWGVLGGSLLFSTLSAIQLWIQVKNVPIPSDIAAMLPAILTIFVLILGGRHRSKKPAALVKPFRRGEN